MLDDVKRAAGDKLFEERIDSQSITEEELQRFGAVILDKHKQLPLRRRLTELVAQLKGPVVVDSIRDTQDINLETLGNRRLIVWFVDCSDSMIRDRLVKKTKLGEKRSMTGSPVDRTAPQIRAAADHIIPNSGSLEDLRWQVDDMLFSIVNLSSRQEYGGPCDS
jgi:hypothetical protein